MVIRCNIFASRFAISMSELIFLCSVTLLIFAVNDMILWPEYCIILKLELQEDMTLILPFCCMVIFPFVDMLLSKGQ
jgi:hypothetical protein